MNGSLDRLELNKILAAAAEYASLAEGRARVLALAPVSVLGEAEDLLARTEEANILLFELGAGHVEVFPSPGDSLERAEKGATLSCTELLGAAALLRSARLCRASAAGTTDGRIVLLRETAERLRCDEKLESEIYGKIIGENELRDDASDRLFSLRREIRLLNERIRARLSAYLTGEERKYLQDEIVTVREDRFVIPVKAEYRRSVRGFVHDRSQSGATFFIEPEEVLEMNNELRALVLDEKEEVERILHELSERVGRMRAALAEDALLLAEIDSFYARAEYGYRLGCVKPRLNGRGVLSIVKGRHPLLDPSAVVPVSVSVGEKYDILLISGANAGGKTVTLKTCGLFCLMAACGIFVPAAEGTRLPVFREVFCDVGDSQSIEENLSTFSSHVVNMREVLARAGKDDFVLIDEPGGGTDPEEGQALAKALLSALLKRGCRAVVTTHYSALKEFAYETDRIENGSMEFDERDYKPLFRLKIGSPGSSNALAICTRLGLPAETVEEARGYLSEGARSFERTVRAAEESRVRAEEERAEADRIKREWGEKMRALEEEEGKFRREKEKFLTSAKAEARRIVNERTARANELLGEIEAVFRKDDLTEADLIKARTLRNRMGEETEEKEPVRAVPVDPARLKAGDRVLVGSMNAEGEVLSVRREKGTAEVMVGSLRVRSKIADLFAATMPRGEKRVKEKRDLAEHASYRPEVNLLGLTAAEAIPEVEALLDGALLAGASEARIVHGMGTGKLRAAVHAYLKKDPHVAEFRLGGYGEGESGVTIVKLK